MAEYGLTPQGVNIKRLDVILEEIHTYLTKAWGVNTQQNPNSLLNAMLTNIADSIAELWELGQDVYFSSYPSTAEGMYLDNATQYIGIARETEAPSYYHILCTGVDGTVIPDDAIIASETSPTTNLRPVQEYTISRNNFNQAVVRVVAVDGDPMSLALDDNIYSVTPAKDTDATAALEELADRIVSNDFDVYVGDDGYLHVESNASTTSHVMILSSNLTTESVGSVFTFATEDTGDIRLPAGSITEITKAVTGLTSVVNVGEYIAGGHTQTDVEYRQSYLKKIFTHASRMLDSIRAAILDNVQGVLAIAVYENDTDYEDEWGRYPHSVEVVVDGGDETEIARQILESKAGGINTFGKVEITLYGQQEEEIIIRFNRPDYVRMWFHCDIARMANSTMPVNYEDLIREIIVNEIGNLSCGENVIPQSLFLPEIYSQVYGIGYVLITMGIGDEKPDEYTLHNYYASVRERVITEADYISFNIHQET